MTGQRVLVVDDDPGILELINDYLAGEGFDVALADSAAAMRNHVAELPFDIVLLDLRLPDGDGFSLATEIRRISDAGIIIVSGKDDVVDRIAALEAGADDYVTKPFHLRELLARLRSLQRRRTTVVGEPTTIVSGNGVDGRVLRFAGWRLEVDARALYAPEGKTVDLTTGEFDLLVALVERPNRALSRDTLLELLHERAADVFDRSIDMQIGRLRRKIEKDPKRPMLIRTVRGIGYKFGCPVESGAENAA